MAFHDTRRDNGDHTATFRQYEAFFVLGIESVQIMLVLRESVKHATGRANCGPAEISLPQVKISLLKSLLLSMSQDGYCRTNEVMLTLYNVVSLGLFENRELLGLEAMPKETLAKTGTSAAYEVILELEESLDRSQMSSFDSGFSEKMPFLSFCRPSRRNYSMKGCLSLFH